MSAPEETAEDVLLRVRKILKVPEAASITEWAEMLIELFDPILLYHMRQDVQRHPVPSVWYANHPDPR